MKRTVSIKISVEIPEGANATDTQALVKEWLKQTINWMDDEMELNGEIIGIKDQIQ